MKHRGVSRIKFLFSCALLVCLSLSGRAQDTASSGNTSAFPEAESWLLPPTRQAQQQLDVFRESFHNTRQDDAYSFSALVFFRPTAERTWVEIREIAGDTYTGYASDVYDNSTNLAAEPLLRFTQDQIEDWRIYDRAKDVTRGDFVLSFQVEQALQDRQSLRLHEEQVPFALRSLIPQAEFWGIQDDLVRAAQREKATPNQKAELVKQLRGKESAIRNWLGNYTSRFTHSTEENSFYYLLVASKELDHGIPNNE